MSLHQCITAAGQLYLHYCRYRDVITQQLQKACGTSHTPVWRQSKDMLLEEGIQVTAQEPDTASVAAPSDAQVQVTQDSQLTIGDMP